MPLPDQHLLDGFSLFDDDSALMIMAEDLGGALGGGGCASEPSVLSEKLPIPIPLLPLDETNTLPVDAAQRKKANPATKKMKRSSAVAAKHAAAGHEKKTTFTTRKKRSSAAAAKRGNPVSASPPEDDDEVNPTDGELYFQLMLMGQGRFLGGKAAPSFFVPELRSAATQHRVKSAAARRKYRRRLLDFQRRSIDEYQEPFRCQYPDRSTAAKARTRVSGRFSSEIKGIFRPATEIQTY